MLYFTDYSWTNCVLHVSSMLKCGFGLNPGINVLSQILKVVMQKQGKSSKMDYG